MASDIGIFVKGTLLKEYVSNDQTFSEDIIIVVKSPGPDTVMSSHTMVHRGTLPLDTTVHSVIYQFCDKVAENVKRILIDTDNHQQAEMKRCLENDFSCLMGRVAQRLLNANRLNMTVLDDAIREVLQCRNSTDVFECHLWARQNPTRLEKFTFWLGKTGGTAPAGYVRIAAGHLENNADSISKFFREAARNAEQAYNNYSDQANLVSVDDLRDAIRYIGLNVLAYAANVKQQGALALEGSFWSYKKVWQYVQKVAALLELKHKKSMAKMVFAAGAGVIAGGIIGFLTPVLGIVLGAFLGGSLFAVGGSFLLYLLDSDPVLRSRLEDKGRMRALGIDVRI